MRQLTVRGFDRRIGREHSRISLNQAVLRLCRRGAGLADHRGAGVVGSSLDRFIGSWTREQADEMNRALKEFASIDETIWE